MTQSDFDQLALKVAEETDAWISRYLSDDQIAEFANQLREEWVKSLEPVAWAATEFGEVKDLSMCDDNGYTLPLYTLLELKK